MKKSLELTILMIICLNAYMVKAHALQTEFLTLSSGTSLIEPIRSQTVKSFFKTTENKIAFSSKFNETSLQFRTVLRDILSVKLNPNIEIGLDSFKVRPLEAECEILKNTSFQAALHSQVETNRGYGLEFRIKLP